MSSPSWWWLEIVLKNYAEYMNHKSSDRTAFNAVITMHHIWERVYWWNVQQAGIPRNDEADKRSKHFHCYLKKTWKRLDINKEMDALAICANAAKHSVQVRKEPSNLATEVLEQIVIDLSTGEKKNVSEILNTAKEFWEMRLREYENMRVDEFKSILNLP